MCAYARGWALLVRFDSIDWWIGTISRLEGTHTHICKYVYIYTHRYRMVRKRRKRQIVEMEEGQAAETVPFVRVTFGQVGSAGREFMGLFHDEGTRRWPVPCGSDLILPIPREDTRGYTCICAWNWPLFSIPNWKYSSGLRNATCPRAT